jgi:hypothetical protein
MSRVKPVVSFCGRQAFALTAVTGALMFVTNATVYFHNTPFRVKMILLALAGLNMLVFELTAGRTIHRWDQALAAPPIGKVRHAVARDLARRHLRGRVIGFTTTRPSQAE